MKTREYYVETNSFAAPIFSDSGSQYVTAANPEAALLQVAKTYSHPCGLYGAAVFTSSDARNKGEEALATWWCNQAIALRDATMILSHGPGDVEIDGVRTVIADPKGGRIMDKALAS